MPPFKLEFPDRRPTHSRSLKIIYTKNIYSEGVKSRNWETHLEFKPADNDPYNPERPNYFISHYNRLGNWPQDEFKTTTGGVLEQINIKSKMCPGKLLANYYTYNDNVECLTTFKPSYCPGVSANELLTTMQHSYQLPYPYKMQRLAMKRIPFMQNVKYRTDEPDLSPCKFYDENFHCGSQEMNKHKGFRTSSYNFMTDSYIK